MIAFKSSCSFNKRTSASIQHPAKTYWDRKVAMRDRVKKCCSFLLCKSLTDLIYFCVLHSFLHFSSKVVPFQRIFFIALLLKGFCNLSAFCPFFNHRKIRFAGCTKNRLIPIYHLKRKLVFVVELIAISIRYQLKCILSLRP